MSREVFWLNEHCVRHPRISGGVTVILRELNSWLREHDVDTLSLNEFLRVLEDEGLKVIKVSGILLVPGFGFKEDWDVYKERFQ